MSDPTDAELEKLDRTLSALAETLEPAARRRAAGKIAAMVRGRQAKRIAAQKNPDGSSYEPRADADEKIRIKQSKKFLYPSGGGTRVVLLKSWRKDGSLLVGYDREAGGLRSFEIARIARFLPLGPEDRNRRAGKLRRKSVKEQQLFRKLRTYARLHLRWDEDGAEVGFRGRTAEIAEVHQGGLTDDVVPGQGIRMRYPKRELLGLTPEEEQLAFEIIAEMVEEALG